MRRRVWRSRVEERNNSIYSAVSLALRVIFVRRKRPNLTNNIRFFHGALQLTMNDNVIDYVIW